MTSFRPYTILFEVWNLKYWSICSVWIVKPVEKRKMKRAFEGCKDIVKWGVIIFTKVGYIFLLEKCALPLISGHFLEKKINNSRIICPQDHLPCYGNLNLTHYTSKFLLSLFWLEHFMHLEGVYLKSGISLILDLTSTYTVNIVGWIFILKAHISNYASRPSHD